MTEPSTVDFAGTDSEAGVLFCLLAQAKIEKQIMNITKYFDMTLIICYKNIILQQTNTYYSKVF